MFCLESWRRLLAAPREQSEAQRRHLASCPRCAALERRLAILERQLQDAALLAVPEALADRILLQFHRRRRSWQYAWAAFVRFWGPRRSLK